MGEVAEGSEVSTSLGHRIVVGESGGKELSPLNETPSSDFVGL